MIIHILGEKTSQFLCTKVLNKIPHHSSIRNSKLKTRLNFTPVFKIFAPGVHFYTAVGTFSYSACLWYTMQRLRNSTIQQATFNNYVAGARWINKRDTIWRKIQRQIHIFPRDFSIFMNFFKKWRLFSLNIISNHERNKCVFLKSRADKLLIYLS